MKLAEALRIDPLTQAVLVAGHIGVQRTVSWIHIVDLPDPLPWVGRDQLLLTTGFSWSRDAHDLRRLISDLDSQGVAGIGLAAPGYWEAAPRAAKDEADRVGLPLLEIPWEIPFFEISSRVNRALLLEQQSISQQSEAVHRALTRAAIEAESLGEIVLVLSELIHRAVTLEDPDGHVIAAHGDQALHDRVRRETIAQGRTQPDVEERLRELGYWSQMRRTTKPLRIPAQLDIELSTRVVCPVWLKDELVGLVWILEGETPLGDLDFRAAEHAAIVVALHIARDRAIAGAEQRLGYSLVDSLLDGRFQADPQSLERAVRLGFDPERAYRVLLFVLDDTGPFGGDALALRDRLARRLERRIALLGEPPLITVSLNQIALLVPEEVDAGRIWNESPEMGVRLCIGRVHRGIEGVRRSYQEARSIAPWVAAGESMRYEALLVPRLLRGDQSARQDFVDDLIGPLVAANPEGAARLLLPTLLALGECGFNQTRAAARLGIHTKTMHYRCKRLQELMGKELTDPEVRFRIQLLGHIMEMESKEGAV